MKYLHRDLSECRYQPPSGASACPETLHHPIPDEEFAGLMENIRVAKEGMAEAFNFLSSPEALASVRRGLRQAGEGKGRVISFAQYAEDD